MGGGSGRWAVPLAIVSLFVLSAFGTMPVQAPGAKTLTRAEAAFVDAFRAEEAWDIAAYLSTPNDGWADSIGLIGKVTGTPALHAAATYIAGKLDEVGVEEVRIEEIPATSWDFRGAQFRVLSPIQTDLKAIVYGSSLGTFGTFDGVAYSTANQEGGWLRLELVDGGIGSVKDLDRIDVRGKAVLILRHDFLTTWPSAPMYEAYLRGAEAIVFYGYYGESQNPDSVRGDTLPGAFYDAPIPAFQVTVNEAHYLQSLLTSGPVWVEGRSEIHIRTLEAGAKSWNVVATVRGTRYPDEYVVLNDQMDTWFYGPSNGNGGIGVMIEIARLLAAEKAAGRGPERSVLFLFNGGEELGCSSQAWFNWLCGSWPFYQMHPELVHHIVGELNIENVGFKSTTGSSSISYTWDASGLAKRSILDLGLQFKVFGSALDSPFGDNWIFSAVYGTSMIDCCSQPGYRLVYHTWNDTMDDQDPEQYHNIGRLFALLAFRLANNLVVPIDLGKSIEWMSASLARDRMRLPEPSLRAAYDAAAAAMDTLATRWKATQSRLSDLVGQWNSPTTPPARRDAIRVEIDGINRAIMEARSHVTWYMFGMGLWMPGWWFFFRPDQHVDDLIQINGALFALRAGDARSAANHLKRVWMMGWGHRVSTPAFDLLWNRFNADLSWGAPWDQQQEYVNVHVDYVTLVGGTLAPGTASHLDAVRGDLVAWIQADLQDVAHHVTVGANLLP